MRLMIAGGGGFRVPLVYRALCAGPFAGLVRELVLYDVDPARLAAINAVLASLAGQTPRAASGELPGAALRATTSLAEALDGISWACATAMTPRDHFATLSTSGHAVAFVFGTERFGMANDDVYRCHACLSIPAEANYGSLNLAQAVQVIAYEWRQALGGYAVEPRTADATRADGTAVQGVLDHWQRTLEHIGFLDPAAPKKLMPRLNQLLNRAQLTQEEVHILRGIARTVDGRRQRD